MVNGLFGAAQNIELAHHFCAVLFADRDAVIADAEHIADESVDTIHIDDIRAVHAQEGAGVKLRRDFGQREGEGHVVAAVQMDAAIAAERLDEEDVLKVDLPETLFFFDEDAVRQKGISGLTVIFSGKVCRGGSELAVRCGPYRKKTPVF